MRSFSKSPTESCSGRALRLWSTAVLTACGVMLAPTAAVADHMPGMPNGVACPHAAGEGPDALAAPGPEESPSPERAPSEAPLGTAQTGAPKPAPAQAPATRPATRPAVQVTQPATQQASQPAARAQAQQPAGATESASSEAVAQQPVAARTAAVPAARRAERTARRADRPARRVERRTFERRFNGLEPRPARPSSTIAEPVVAVAERPRPAAAPAAAAAEPPRPAAAPAAAARTPVIVAFALLTLLGLAGAVLVGRRRGDGGVAAGEAPARPAAPSYADAALEAELHELIAEARARELLDGEHEPAGEPVGPR